MTCLKLLLGGSFSMLAIAFMLFATVPTTARADGCNQYIYHWGKTSHSRWRAKRNALRGIRWKVRTKLSGAYYQRRRNKVVSCKLRSRHRWQCQALAVVNRCVS